MLRNTIFFSFFSLFFHPIHLRPSFSLSLLVVTQIRGHIAGSSPPLPTTVRALHYRENISALSCLVDSRRIELCLPTLDALSSWSFFFVAKKVKISPRRDSNSRTNTSSIRGLPLDHRGDRHIDSNLAITGTPQTPQTTIMIVPCTSTINKQTDTFWLLETRP